MTRLPLAAVALGVMVAIGQGPTDPATTDDWPAYGHDPGGMRYSSLRQIDRENVGRSTVAWTFHTGDLSDGSGSRKRGGFEGTPVLVDGTLYETTGFNRVIAINPETGAPK